MDVNAPTALLGGLTPRVFMRRHWQKAPLLVRQALPGAAPPLARPALFALAGRDDVESRLVVRDGARWQVRRGPLARRALPPLGRPGWTLLVQGLDLHVDAAHALLERFRFIPDARLDDLMVSWASDGGGVGPHVDSYDVFLLQLAGRRRWRVAPAGDAELVDGAPLKILRRFEPVDDWVLEPGDMLYLPPGWGHDGSAEGGDCMTASIGFRAPSADALARELLLRLAERDDRGALYRDPGQPASPTPAELPAPLLTFARRALERVLGERGALERALGEVLSEPKAQVWFDAGDGSGGADLRAGVALDRRTRMLYDARHVFINGEAYRAGGRDAQLMRRLADERRLAAADCAALSGGARAWLAEWAGAGWLETIA